jgi:chromosome partitioning protein
MDSIIPAFQRFDLTAMEELTGKANEQIDKVRTEMLDPHTRKKPPTFTGAQVARMSNIEPKQMTYLARRGDLPAGEHSVNGGRRHFSLAEAREYVRRLSGIPFRPTGTQAAVISIVNFKGGSAKTSTTFNLAQGLTLRGRKVLVIDLDAQASSTTLTGLIPPVEVNQYQTAAPLFYKPRPAAWRDAEGSEVEAPPESASWRDEDGNVVAKPDVLEDGQVAVLVDGTQLYFDGGFVRPDTLEYAVQPTYWDGLDIVPATPGLYNAEILLPISSQDPDVKWWNVINRAIEPLREQYDYILFDTAPALSYLAVNAVMASDALVMPVPPETLDFASSVAFWNMLSETVGALNTSRHVQKDFAFMRVLLSKVDKAFSTSMVRDWIMKAYGQYVLPVEVPKNMAGSLTAVKLGTVFDIDKSAFRGAGVGVGTETYDKLREAYEKVAEMVDETVMTTVWKMGVEQ